jgi:multidrug resistance efflux pump
MESKQEKKVEVGHVEHVEHHAHKRQNILQRYPIIVDVLIVLVVAVASVAFIYLYVTGERVYIENSELSAPVITLNPSSPGILDKVFVKEGNVVGKGSPIASIGGEIMYPKTQGVIINVMNTPGQFVTSQNAIAQMINPEEMRVIGHIQENKGLNEIRPGQRVVFTVDAFGSKQYEGAVERVNPSARQNDIVFSISSQREEREFDVVVHYDISKYPELLNGMSAKMWVYK